jgi:hypothetical protein
LSDAFLHQQIDANNRVTISTKPPRGFTFAYNSVKRFCRGLRQREPEQFDRLEFLPGE